MKIYVFSDSHGNCEHMLRVLEENAGEYDTVIHLGDCSADTKRISSVLGVTPLISIVGNCDTEIPDPTWGESCDVKLYGVRFFMCHGHRQMVNTTYSVLYAEAESRHCRAALFGHTHVPLCETSGGVTIFNPGSIGAPIYGQVPSYGVITIDGDMVCYEIRRVKSKSN